MIEVVTGVPDYDYCSYPEERSGMFFFCTWRYANTPHAGYPTRPNICYRTCFNTCDFIYALYNANITYLTSLPSSSFLSNNKH